MYWSWAEVRIWGVAVLAGALALLATISLAGAQPASAPPLTVEISEQQLDQIVRSVTSAVLSQLKDGPAAAEQPQPAAPAPVSTGPAVTEEGFASFMVEREYLFVSRLEAALRAIPALGAEIGSILSRLDARPEGRGALAFLGLIAAVLAAALGLGYAATAAALRWLPAAAPGEGAASIGETLRRGAASLAGASVFWIVTAVVAGKLFGGPDMQARVGHWLLLGIGQFAVFYTLFLIWFRPSAPACRIVPLDDRDAWPAMRLFAVMLGIVVFRSWILILMADGQPVPVIAAGLLLNNLVFVAGFFAAALPARAAIRHWIENSAMGVHPSALRRWLAANWLPIAGSSVVLVSAVHAYGAVAGLAGVAGGLTGTVRTVLAMILLCAVVEFIGRRSGGGEASAARRAIPRLPGLVGQMLRLFLLLGAAIYFIKLWFVDALAVMSTEQWARLADHAFEPLAALFAAYMAIAYVNFLSARYLVAHPVAPAAVGEDDELPMRAQGESSRLRTLIPIIRVTSIVIVVVMTGLLVISHLGFDITPLLAGASVIGLAISFGSQALVKDIVSGVLFLAEDSFRVGEYIECGKSIGTVEGFTLRSVRLRHQDGQIYTVPFGQIGEITNFSRDWATVKFNMSLDRDVDLEDVRSVAKTVAAELKAEFGDRLLEPLKVQGVKDVTDTAIVVQFKFTSLPRGTGEIERTARSRLLKAFREDGIALSRHPWLAAAAGVPA